MKKSKIILKTIVIIIVWNLVFIPILYFAYMNRVENTFKYVRDYTLNSKVLEKEIGKIEKVRFNNFMQWISSKNSESCIKLNVTTKDRKYNVCAILHSDKFKNKDDIKIIGYFIDDKKIEIPEKISKTMIIISDKMEKTSYSISDLETKSNMIDTYKEIINSNSIQSEIKKTYSNVQDIELEKYGDTDIFSVIYSCKQNKEKECIDINKQYVSSFINIIDDMYNVNSSILEQTIISSRVVE